MKFSLNGDVLIEFIEGSHFLLNKLQKDDIRNKKKSKDMVATT